MQTFVVITAPRPSKKLMTVARAGMIVVSSCSVVILSWLVASVAIQEIDILNSDFIPTVLTILNDDI